MKTIALIGAAIILTGCASAPKSSDYQIYAEQTAKIIQATSASEAACFLVVAEGVKSGDNSTKTVIATQIERCKKDTPKIEAPKKSWLGL